MKELKVGERVTITFEVVVQNPCDDCFFGKIDRCKEFACSEHERSDHKNVIFKEVKE